MIESALSKAKKLGLKELRMNKPFMLLLAAKLISRFGDSIDSIAYSWMVYVLTGSKVLMGTIFAINFVPGILFSIFTGVFVDRGNPRFIIILADAGRGTMVILTGLLYWLGHLQPWHLFMFTFINSTFECFASPAEMALLPRILPKELLLRGNSISSTSSRIAELAGLASAGALIGIIGISGAIIIDGITFIISALLIVFIAIPRYTSSSSKPSSTQQTSYLQEFKVGLKFITSQKLILIIMCVATFVNLCLTPFNVLNTVYVKELLHAGPIGLSIMGIALIIGMIVSGLWLSTKGSFFKKSSLIVSGFVILSINYALLFIPVAFPIYPLYTAAFFSFGIGFAVTLVSTPTATYLMEVTPQEMLGRVGALFNMVCTCAIPIGSVLAGLIAELASVHIIYFFLGGLLMAPVIYLLTQRDFMKV